MGHFRRLVPRAHPLPRRLPKLSPTTRLLLLQMLLHRLGLLPHIAQHPRLRVADQRATPTPPTPAAPALLRLPTTTTTAITTTTTAATKTPATTKMARIAALHSSNSNSSNSRQPLLALLRPHRAAPVSIRRQPLHRHLPRLLLPVLSLPLLPLKALLELLPVLRQRLWAALLPVRQLQLLRRVSLAPTATNRPVAAMALPRWSSPSS